MCFASKPKVPPAPEIKPPPRVAEPQESGKVESAATTDKNERSNKRKKGAPTFRISIGGVNQPGSGTGASL